MSVPALPHAEPRSSRGAFRPGLRRATVAVTAALGIALAGTATASAKTVLWSAKTFPTESRAAATPDRVYDADGPDVSATCVRKGRAGVPLTVGWSNLRAPAIQVQTTIAGTYSLVRIDTRYGLTASKPKAHVLCADGALKPTSKRNATGKSISCGKKLAIGAPVSNTWPYIETAVTVRPNGKSGWYVDAGERGYVQALCVSAAAFKRVTTVRKTGSFRTGATDTTVSASCPGGRRPIAWGHEAAPLATNVWTSSESTNTFMRTPFVSDAVPSGKSGWKVTFRTPDQQPAQSSAALAVHLTCAQPA